MSDFIASFFFINISLSSFIYVGESAHDRFTNSVFCVYTIVNAPGGNMTTAEMIWLFQFHFDKQRNALMFRCTKMSYMRFRATINKSQIWPYFSLFELRGRTSHCSDLNIFCASSSHTSCKYWQRMTLSKYRSPHKIWQRLSVSVCAAFSPLESRLDCIFKR